jgi:hypothetical protein
MAVVCSVRKSDSIPIYGKTHCECIFMWFGDDERYFKGSTTYTWFESIQT